MLALVFVTRRTSGQKPWFQQIGPQTRGLAYFIDVESVTPESHLCVT